MDNKRCKDCNKIISKKAIRCRKCAKQGKLHSWWGRKHSEKSKKSMSKTHSEKKLSKTHKKNISKSLIGNNRASGYKWSKKQLDKISLDWTNLTYKSKHHKIYRLYGKATKCENLDCLGKSKIFQWSNISRKYLEDRSDWQELCHHCHTKYDKFNIKIRRK